MNSNKGLLSSGLGMVMRNKRYILWFWLLNLTLAEFGTAAFRRSAHAILDHSFLSVISRIWIVSSTEVESTITIWKRRANAGGNVRSLTE